MNLRPGTVGAQCPGGGPPGPRPPLLPPLSLPPEKLEIPHDETHENQGHEIDQNHVQGHLLLPGSDSGSKNRSRFALVTTVTELKAMAAPAMTGERRMPKKG